MICRPSGDEAQCEQRYELDHADQAEPQRCRLNVHRLAGDVVNLPADDDDHRHLRDGGCQPRDPEGTEGRDAQRFGEQAHRQIA
jgi:hypothetical protein